MKPKFDVFIGRSPPGVMSKLTASKIMVYSAVASNDFKNLENVNAITSPHSRLRFHTGYEIHMALISYFFVDKSTGNPVDTLHFPVDTLRVGFSDSQQQPITLAASIIHRTDGPAVITPDGSERWYWLGMECESIVVYSKASAWKKQKARKWKERLASTHR